MAASQNRVSRNVVGTWTAVGAGVGAALGTANHSVALWLAIGVAVGALIGYGLHRQQMNA